MVMKNDTFICLGDVGTAKYLSEIKLNNNIELIEEILKDGIKILQSCLSLPQEF